MTDDQPTTTQFENFIFFILNYCIVFYSTVIVKVNGNKAFAL